MFLHHMRVVPLIVALASCSGNYAGTEAPPTGNNTASAAPATLNDVLDSAPEASGGKAIFKKLPIRPNTAAPPILINFVADGPNQGGVPCIDCVNGASTSYNIGMTGPSSYVLSNFTWQYALSFTDISYKGKCKLAWAITNGKNTIDSFSKTLTITSSGGFIIYALARSRPKYSGAATLTGKVTCGKTSGSLQSPLQFE